MSSVERVPEGILMGIGNPLLDITVEGNADLLEEYNLNSNNAIIAEEKHKTLFEKMVKEYKPIFLAGGATQNSIRVAQWLLQKPGATTFFGGVGNDIYYEILKKTVEQVGVNVHYEVHSGKATGKCGAIITGEDRSLVTELGAAEMFTADFLKQPENWALVEKAQFYYIGGFIVPASSEAVLGVLKHAANTGKTVIMNLHAKFLCQYFADSDFNLLQYVDVLFGNGDEATEFGKHMGFNTTNVEEIAKLTSLLPKLNKNRERTVVFTQGKSSTILAVSGKTTVFQVVPVDRSIIKDTNGCGDAFVGGFLSQLVQNKSIEDCMRCGSYAAKVVIRHYGCNFPPKPDFE
ncbi:hypothetical protein KUTeg_017666 [Tegillarca granosa]|uniref:Adenosine kinase n=1 Tax=Tegillarca granosa TaxID=220873 RepID=A0ABQ9EFK7_TEGGR|nr:hypothetical protein KUTeg_017666 [Tegillarca granosa]